MKKTIFVLIGLLSLYGCAKKSEEASASADSMSFKGESEESMAISSKAYAPSANKQSGGTTTYANSGNATPIDKYISSSAAQANPLDTSRKLIIKADLKFKVKSVTQATYRIEDLVKKEGGFVTSSELTSNVSYTESTAISADSTLESKHYTMVNYLTVRVPNTKLDTSLKQIAKLIEYLDYRNIRVEDVALQIKANKWRKNRYQGSARRLTKIVDDNAPTKVEATIAAEDRLLNSQEQEEQAVISNLELEDQIRFSTITLTLYQNPSVYRELIANEANIEAYQPSFGTRLLNALAVGWDSLQTAVLVLVKLWWLLVIVTLIYLGVKQYRSRSQK